MTTPLSQALREALAFKGKRNELTHPCATECSGYSQGVQDGAFGQNARLEPLHKALCEAVDALEFYSGLIEHAEKIGLGEPNCEIGLMPAKFGTRLTEALGRLRELVGK